MAEKQIKKHDYIINRKIVSDRYLNVSKIHPLKQRQVNNLINFLKENDSVNRIIIFGSSVTNRCRTGSDLDFYVELDDNKDFNKAISSVISNYDYWNNFTVDSRLLNEIQKKGVLVYERKNDA